MTASATSNFNIISVLQLRMFNAVLALKILGQVSAKLI